MAGIGFQLQRLLKSDSYSARVMAYMYSAMLSCGPWLLSVVSLTLIGILSAAHVKPADLRAFQSLVIYTFTGTLILTGPLQLVTTRYVADRLYVGDSGALAPCYHWVCTLVVLAGAIAAGAAYAVNGIPASDAAAGIVLFQTIALTWIGMIFLSAAKGYSQIVRCFAIGYGLSLIGTMIGTERNGASGMLWGFVIGQILLVGLITVRVRLEFPTDRPWDASILRYARAMPALIVIGLFYNLGIWADKVAFWFGPGGQHVVGWIYVNPRYDACSFVGFVSIVPALALFLIRVETAFYKNYAAYFDCIIHGGSMEAIAERRQAMVAALRLSMSRLIKVQGAITLLLMWMGPQVLSWLSLPPDILPMLRILLLAAFLQAMLLVLVVVILYFDWQRDVAFLTIGFFLLNAGLSVLSFRWDERYHGCGYLLACLLSLLWGLAIFDRRMEKLDYDTFTKQPMGR